MTQRAFLGWDGDKLAFDDGAGGVMRLPAYGEVVQNAAAAERAAGRDPALVYQRQGGAGLPVAAPAPIVAPAPMVPEAMPVEPVAQATTPMQTRSLAYQGAGGAGSGPPTVEPVAMTTPPPPNYSTPGGPLAVESTGAPAPPPAPPPAATPAPPPAGRQLPPVAPPLASQAAPAPAAAVPQGMGVDPGIDALGRRVIGQLLTGSPGVRRPAEWRPETSVVEQREAPQAEVDAYNRALAEQAAVGGEVAQVRSDLADQGRQAEAQRRDKNVEADAMQAAADRKAQEEDLRFEQQIDADRKSLADPNSFWNDKTSNYKTAMFAFAALSGIGNVIAGKDPGDFMAGLRRVIDADIEAKKGNIGLLGEARRRARERYGDETKAREVARAAAMRHIDDQVKDLAAQSANPIVKRAVMADFPSLQEGMNFLGNEVIAERNKQRAAQGQPPLTPAEEEDQRRGYVTRYLGAELEAVNAKVAAARERLGIADKYAATYKDASKYLPARTEGGRAADPMKAWGVAKDLQELGFKGAEVGGKVVDHAVKAEEAQAKREDREGARVFMLPDGRGGMREFVARPGTDPKTVTELQKSQADLAGFQDDINELSKLHTVKDRTLANTKLTALKSSMVGKGTKLIGGGVVGEAEFDRMNKILSATDWFSPGGVDAAKTMHQSLASGTRALAEQVGAKPRPGGR